MCFIFTTDNPWYYKRGWPKQPMHIYNARGVAKSVAIRESKMFCPVRLNYTLAEKLTGWVPPPPT